MFIIYIAVVYLLLIYLTVLLYYYPDYYGDTLLDPPLPLAALIAGFFKAFVYILKGYPPRPPVASGGAYGGLLSKY